MILYRLDLRKVFWYFTITVQPCSMYLLVMLFRAKNAGDYHFLSNLSKLIMVAGILSMEAAYISL